MRQQARLRRRQVEDNRCLVRCVDSHRFAADGNVILRLFEDVRVEHQIVMIELHVGTGERRAVGPFMALAKMEGQLREVVIPLPALGNVRHDCLQIIRETDEVHMANGQEVGCAGFGRVRQHVEGAAIFANTVVRHDHKRLGRNTVGKWRQIRIALDLGIQCRAIRISGERHGASGSSFEFSFFELLRVGTICHALHIRHGHSRAVGIGADRQGQQRQG